MSKAKESAANKTKRHVEERNETVRVLAEEKRTWNKPHTWRQKQNAKVYHPLPKARDIFKASLVLCRSAVRPVVGVSVIYGLGVVLLVRGFSAAQDFATLKALLDSAFSGAVGELQGIAVQLTVLFGGAGSSNTPNGAIYQTILLVVCSLAIIWIFRQHLAGKQTNMKASFYSGMYPLIPFVGVATIIGIQLLPMSIGSYAYSTAVSGSIVSSGFERFIFFIIAFLLVMWSLRMITGSLFALYIVTLPNMTPLRALRSAKQLVAGRRLQIWRKLLFLPLFIIVGTSLLVLPFMFFLTPVVVWVFFLASIAWFPLVHSYLYTLYRELLNE